MGFETRGLKIALLENLYDIWGDREAENLFRDVIGLKLRGYGKEYPYGVLPVDGNDLISTHMLVCELENGALKPMMGIRWTSLKKCQLHYTTWPGLSLVQQAGAPEHLAAMEKLIASANERKVDIFYSGALTIEPVNRGNKQRSLALREILTGMYVGYQREHRFSELLAGGTVRFKIHDWLASLGHKPLALDGRDLGPINVRHLAGETVQVMHMSEFSFEARRIAKKWEQLWNERIVFGPDKVALPEGIRKSA